MFSCFSISLNPTFSAAYTGTPGCTFQLFKRINFKNFNKKRIFATQWPNFLYFILRFFMYICMKYLSSTTLGCKDIGLEKFLSQCQKHDSLMSEIMLIKFCRFFQGYGVLFFTFVALFFPEENFTFMMFPSSTFLYSSTDTASHRL